ncbi:MAG: PaaI family thioesterase [Burkholderiales bacterium]|jgi:uncharacterized protein (TIGR00369 family)|nr:PaaI family thioesterase [Burkholderiales bacterium]
MAATQEQLRQWLERGFRDAPFVVDLGITLADLGPGWCEATLALAPRHLQQHGVVHAGVLSAMADHCAGAAATTTLGEGDAAMTVEFKINLLRAARGESLRCRAQVLKPGKSFAVVESEVFAAADGKEALVAKLTATLAVIRTQ